MMVVVEEVLVTEATTMTIMLRLMTILERSCCSDIHYDNSRRLDCTASGCNGNNDTNNVTIGNNRNECIQPKWTENTQVIAKSQLIQHVLHESCAPAVVEKVQIYFQYAFMFIIWTQVL